MRPRRGSTLRSEALPSAMSSRSHWEEIYRTKSPGQTSWYAPHLRTSLDWICEAIPDRAAQIIDVGGGESTLVDDLVSAGYRDVTVLDVAEAAIEKTRVRLGASGSGVGWIAGDVTEIVLPEGKFKLWHDRAVFHFLTEPEPRAAYLRQLTSALRHGGHLILATFGPEGPQKCSGLPVRRYNADLLNQELGPRFRLEKSAIIDHQTPFGTAQQFLYSRFLFG